MQFNSNELSLRPQAEYNIFRNRVNKKQNKNIFFSAFF